MHLYSGYYTISFVNIDAPEDKISVNIEAHANDNGDKAPGKAITYATKSAILKVFCLETGDDEESRTFEPEPLIPAKQKLEDSRLDKAIEQIKTGDFGKKRLFERFDLTPDQILKVFAEVPENKEAAQ